MKKLFVLLFISCAGYASACTNFIVGKNASADGSVFCTYSADSYGLYAARNITIDDSEVDATGNDYGIAASNALTINSGSVTASGTGRSAISRWRRSAT